MLSQRSSMPIKTQWAAQFLVAGELARWGYLVSFTMGNNTPQADLMVGHLDGGEQFWVDVKGKRDSATDAWLIGDKKDLKNLFYILVRIGKRREQEDRFFILTQAEAKDEIRKYWEAHPYQKPTAALSGFSWSAVLGHEDKWEKLLGFKDAVSTESL